MPNKNAEYESRRVREARFRDFLDREGVRAIRLLRKKLGFTSKEMCEIMGYSPKMNKVANMENGWLKVTLPYYMALLALEAAMDKGKIKSATPRKLPFTPSAERKVG